MTLPIKFRRVAKSEFHAAVDWYEERREGLGEEFLDAIQKVLDTIADHPHRYPIADGDVREAPVSRFPYCIYYRVKPREIVVLAVFHTSRDPSVWRGRN